MNPAAIPPQSLVPGQVYRIHIPYPNYTSTGLVKAKVFANELCTLRVSGLLEPVRCEHIDTYFTPATPEECAEFTIKNRW